MSPQAPVQSDKNPSQLSAETPLAFATCARRRPRTRTRFLDLDIILVCLTVLVLLLVSERQPQQVQTPVDRQSQARPHRNENRFAHARRVDGITPAAGAPIAA
jgi:hypothetical protein